MKVLLLIALLLGIGYYFYYQRAPEPKEEPKAVAAAAAAAAPTPEQHPFESLAALLKQDMDGIPAQLDGAGHTPTNAVSIKRRVGTHAGERPEYTALVQSCDLILQADAEHAALQQACHTDQTRASFGTSLNSSGAMDHAVSTRNTAKVDPAISQAKVLADVHQKYDTAWTSYRTQTACKVQSLLGPLSGKTLPPGAGG